MGEVVTVMATPAPVPLMVAETQDDLSQWVAAYPVSGSGGPRGDQMHSVPTAGAWFATIPGQASGLCIARQCAERSRPSNGCDVKEPIRM